MGGALGIEGLSHLAGLQAIAAIQGAANLAGTGSLSGVDLLAIGKQARGWLWSLLLTFLSQSQDASFQLRASTCWLSANSHVAGVCLRY